MNFTHIPAGLLPRLVIGFVLLAPVPLGGLAWLQLSAFERAHKDSVLDHLASIADKKSNQINAYIDERRKTTRMLARLATTRALLQTRPTATPPQRSRPAGIPSDPAAFFQALLDGKDYHDMLLIDPRGNVIFSIRQAAGGDTNLDHDPWRQTALGIAWRTAMRLREGQITPAERYTPADNLPTIFFVAPVFDRTEPIGAVALQINMHQLTDVTHDRTGLGNSGETVIAQRDGAVALYIGELAHAPNAAFSRRVPVAETPPPMRAGLTGTAGQGMTYDYAKTAVAAAWRHLPALGWSMVVKIDADEALAPYLRLRNLSLSLLLGLLLIASLIAWRIGRSLLQPIYQLIDATERIAAGNLRERAPTHGCDEFRDLAVSFNRMTDRIAEEQALLAARVRERTAALADSEAILRRAQFVAQIGSWHLDLADNKLIWSDETCRIFGIPPGAVLAYEDFIAAVHADDRAAVNAAWQAALKGAPYAITHRIVIDGAVKWVRELAEIVFSPAGQLATATGTVQDVTAQVEAEISLRAAKQAADAANQSKSEFLANMSHEIRTPMNAMLGLTQLVLDSPLAPQQADYLRKALSSGRALLGILNDILDYSKIEAGRLDIEHTPYSVAHVMQEVGDLYSAKLAEKKLGFHLEIPADLPASVLGDPLRLHQVLANLIGNAIKFTPSGAVAVSVEYLPAMDESAMLRFAVRDTGIGIDKTVMDRLFQPFTQADSSITRQFGGTGLGLAICRRLVNLMHGDISASGLPGEGSTFGFTIRVGLAAARPHPHAQPAEPPEKSALARRRFDGARVLVVEDNLFNQQVAAGFLKKLGIAVTLADNGSDAVAFASHQRFDAILMDLHMPVLDGLAAARAILALPHGTQLPIIAMTAAVMAEDRLRCQAAGMIDFVPKPVDPDELLRVLDRHLPGPPETTGDASTNAPASTADLPALPGFDLAGALRRLGGERALLERLLDDFSRAQADLPAQLSRLLAAGDQATAAAVLHGLKGAAGNLGAADLANLARQLEDNVRAGLPIDPEQLQPPLAAVAAASAALCATTQPPAAGASDTHDLDPAALANLIATLRPYLEERELLPDSLMQVLASYARRPSADGLFARLLRQIDDFDHAGALDTLAHIAARMP